MPSRARQRVTIDLRGLGDRLNACAERRAVTCSSVVRAAVLAFLEGDGAAQQPGALLRSGPSTKVMLRMPASHAATLAQRSRVAGVSLGDYVAGLLDQAPRPAVPADHRSLVTALSTSTDRIALLSIELRSILREQSSSLEGRAPGDWQQVGELAMEVRQHLELAAQVLGDLRPLRNLSVSRPLLRTTQQTNRETR